MFAVSCLVGGSGSFVLTVLVGCFGCGFSSCSVSRVLHETACSVTFVGGIVYITCCSIGLTATALAFVLVELV